jgi:hypothetical protein
MQTFQRAIACRHTELTGGVHRGWGERRAHLRFAAGVVCSAVCTGDHAVAVPVLQPSGWRIIQGAFVGEDRPAAVEMTKARDAAQQPSATSRTRKRKWRKCMGIEPTHDAFDAPCNGFEDRGRHQSCRHFRMGELAKPATPKRAAPTVARTRRRVVPNGPTPRPCGPHQSIASSGQGKRCAWAGLWTLSSKRRVTRTAGSLCRAARPSAGNNAARNAAPKSTPTQHRRPRLAASNRHRRRGFFCCMAVRSAVPVAR